MIKKTLPLTLPVAMLALAGCLSDSGGGGNEPRIGQLTLTGIEGLRYETASQSGETNSEGEFRYYEGETISFWIGNLQIASGVPAKPFLTPIDFSESNRRLLQSASSDRFGLSTHRIVEERLAREDAQTVNIMRMLLILDEDRLNRLGDAEDPQNNIKLTDRVIDQFNEGLARLERPVDLTVDIGTFAARIPDSPINSVIQQICFYPEDDRRCDTPANQSEIDRLEAELGEFEDDEKESDEYKALQARLQELREKNREIEEARRAVGDRSVTTVETFLVEQTRRYSSIAARNYYITPFELSIPASDTGIKTLEIRSYRGEPDLTGLDAISTNQDAVMVPRWSAQMREVDFYITGDPGSEGEVRISYRPAGDYRWFQSQIRPIIE